MGGFKLLGIVPLKGCDSSFTNNLKLGEVYKFYQDYDIRCDFESSTISYHGITGSKNISSLYNLKNGVNVSVSAVVGLNGSGKSSLIELLYYFIYKLGVEHKAYEEPSIYANSGHNKNLKKQYTELRAKLKDSESKSFEVSKAQNFVDITIKDLNEEKIKQLNEADYLAKIDKLIEQKITYHEKQAATDKKLEKNIKNSLKVAIVYEMDNEIFTLYNKGEKYELDRIHPQLKDDEDSPVFDLNNFFYSVSLNYSHHSLNSKSIGNWINSLFHKNDAYTTPVVINPMRNEGNFNVNRELHLNNERLFATMSYNLVKKNESRLLNKYSVTKLIFSIKKSVVPIFCKDLEHRSEWFSERNNTLLLKSHSLCRILDKKEFNGLLSVKLIKKHLNIKVFQYDFPFLNYAIGYLESKIEKLKDTYPQFFQTNGEIDETKFNDFLQSETTHITKKFRQTLNFLKIVYKNEKTIWEKPTTLTSNRIDPENFLKWLKLNDKNCTDLSPLGLLEFAMPGFTTVDYELKSENNSELTLRKMSSGEQQMLFNINTVIYHLLNLQSIFNLEEDKFKRVKYKNISIILDEIELYYHPEMQRKLVKSILDAVETIRLKTESGIESINMCFLTHSPFILSDIPSSNILRLVDGKPEPKGEKTFGANIHDLLANDFFLKNGFMGEFAKEKINEVISFLNHERLDRELENLDKNEKSDKEKINELNRRRKELPLKSESLDIEKCLEIILLIGEPFLRDTLIGQYYDVSPKNEKAETRFLERLAIKLNYTISKN